MSQSDDARRNEPGDRGQRDGQSRQPNSQGAQTAAENGSPEEMIVVLRDELQQAQDRTLRMQAELENLRQRMRREMEQERRYAELPLIRDLLPVVDNLYRAIEAAETGGEQGALLEGVRMLAQQLHSVLTAHHCQSIEALHQPFDPHLHEAILQQPSSEYPPSTVLAVTQRGYLLHDRVVRPAQVIVSMAPSAQ